MGWQIHFTLKPWLARVWHYFGGRSRRVNNSIQSNFYFNFETAGSEVIGGLEVKINSAPQPSRLPDRALRVQPSKLSSIGRGRFGEVVEIS